LHTSGLTLETIDIEHIGHSADVLEKVVRKLRTGTMPPLGMPRPTPSESQSFVSTLEAALDRSAGEHPNPGRPAVHRLNRAEYGNAVRDLFALEVNVDSLLPPDNSALGFDNIADALSVSPLLLERYMSAARQISRLAIGDPAPRLAVYDVPRDLSQDERVAEGLPLGSQGGTAIRHNFPADGEYTIRIRLQRNGMDEIRGLADAHQIDLRIDGQRVRLFSVGGEVPERGKEGIPAVHAALTTYLVGADDGFELRLPIKAGAHLVSVTALGSRVKPEGPPQPPVTPRSADLFQGRNTGFGVGRLEIRGPDNVTGLGDTPSRRRILLCRPSAPRREVACARRILSTLARAAYRRSMTEGDLQELLTFYKSGRVTGTFESGIEMALRRMLMSPYFLFRIEQDPADVPSNSPYQLGDLELASRLSFFLWSSIPDESLLDVAIHHRLKDPNVLVQQVRRMLSDARSTALLSDFVGQWLEVRNLPMVTPNEDAFPDFDENLRRDFRRETELFLKSILHEDRSVLDLLAANYTFLNERLARFYGIPDVYGDRFRRVVFDDDQNARSGILGQGSVLTVTSYATRTSPVLRGKWILSNLLGTPPPPPPPNVPALNEKSADGKALSMRQAMEAHRKNPPCASCHARMDPLGFALENFDAIGKWRATGESNEPIDSSGTLPNGTPFQGAVGLRQALLGQRQEFVETFAEKLLTYAIGRGLESSDMPAVRRIVRESAASEYRLSSVILGIVRSTPFQMRSAAAREMDVTVTRNR
jgi:hypothetical protein